MGDPFAQPLPVTPTPAPSAGAGIIPVLPPPTLTPSAGSESPLDTLGRLLFGQGNGSALGGIPIVGDIGRALGPVASAGVGLAIKPIDSLTLAADIDDLFRDAQTDHYGLEAVLVPGLLAGCESCLPGVQTRGSGCSESCKTGARGRALPLLIGVSLCGLLSVLQCLSGVGAHAGLST